MTVRSGRRRRDWDGWPYQPLCARWFSAPRPSQTTSAGGAQGLYPNPRCPMARDIGTCLIEPKTPFYRRFEVLAPSSPIAPIMPSAAALTRRRPASERLTPSRTATWRTVWPSRNNSAARYRMGGFREGNIAREPVQFGNDKLGLVLSARCTPPRPSPVQGRDDGEEASITAGTWLNEKLKSVAERPQP